MSRTPHLVTSKIGMAKSMSSGVDYAEAERGGMTVHCRVDGSRV